MKTSRKLFFDKYVAGTLARVLNLLVIPLGKLLKIDHSLNKDFKHIAVCKYKGMGSIIQATPLLQTLKTNYPQAKLVFISSVENKAILERIPSIDDKILIDDKSFGRFVWQLFPFVRKLIAAKFELYIDLEVYSNFSTIISILSISQNRFGFYLNSKHYRLGNYTHMMYYNTRSAISETYLQFARILNCNPIHHHLHIDSQNISTERLTQTFGFNFEQEKYILINPNASDLRIERRWPRKHFIELIEQLQTQYPDYRIYLLGSPAESTYVETIMDSLLSASGVYSLAGKTNINDLITIIKQATLMITNDTGPMHIAFSTNTPTIALFGPCSPHQYGNNKMCFPVYENLYCSPCVHEFVLPPCKGNNRCMTAISTKKVFGFVSAFLDNKIAEAPKQSTAIMFAYKDFAIGSLNR